MAVLSDAAWLEPAERSSLPYFTRNHNVMTNELQVFRSPEFPL